MRSFFVFALCLVALFCSARAHPLGFKTDFLLLSHKSYSLPEFDGGHKGFRKLLQSSKINLALMTAALGGNATLVEAALARGADPNFVEDEGKYTPLIVAAGRNHVEVVKLLIKAGATVDLRTRQDFTALEVGAISGATEAVEALLEAGADPNNEDAKGATPVHLASVGGHAEVVMALVEGGGDFERKTAGETAGHTPLFIAATRGHLGVVKYLISIGANVNVETEKRRLTPLHGAAVGNFGVVVHALIDAGAEINKTSEGGFTALVWAAFFGSQQTIEVLLDAGADKALKSDGGATARDALCQCIFSSEVAKDCKVEACDRPARMMQLLD